MTYNRIRFDVDGGIRRITLDRPDRLNAIDLPLVDQVVHALEQVAADPQVRVVVLAGAGRGFCAGADVGMMDDNIAAEAGGAGPWGADQVRMKLRAGFQRLTRAVFQCQVPTVAAVRGPAVGGGLDLVCACDLAVASDTARFKVAYTERGLFPDLGGFWFLPRIVGYRRAAELIFTARFVDAAEALQLGLINRVVPDGELEAAVDELAGSLAAGPPIALRLGKLLMQRTENLPLETALEMGALGTAVTESSADFREAVTAFLEGRTPEFRGH